MTSELVYEEEGDLPLIGEYHSEVCVLFDCDESEPIVVEIRALRSPSIDVNNWLTYVGALLKFACTLDVPPHDDDSLVRIAEDTEAMIQLIGFVHTLDNIELEPYVKIVRVLAIDDVIVMVNIDRSKPNQGSVSETDIIVPVKGMELKIEDLNICWYEPTHSYLQFRLVDSDGDEYTCNGMTSKKAVLKVLNMVFKDHFELSEITSSETICQASIAIPLSIDDLEQISTIFGFPHSIES